MQTVAVSIPRFSREAGKQDRIPPMRNAIDQFNCSYILTLWSENLAQVFVMRHVLCRGKRLWNKKPRCRRRKPS